MNKKRSFKKPISQRESYKSKKMNQNKPTYLMNCQKCQKEKATFDGFSHGFLCEKCFSNL